MRTSNPDLLTKAHSAINAQKHLWQHTAIEVSQKDLFLPESLQLLQPISNSEQVTGYALTKSLIQSHAALNNSAEWHLSLLALNHEIRKYWVALAIARCKEAQHIQDPMVLIQRIQSLGEASAWLLEHVEVPAQLEATPLASLERELLGCELHENSAYPILFRILKVAYDLQVTQTDLQNLDEVDVMHKEFERNWSVSTDSC